MPYRRALAVLAGLFLFVAGCDTVTDDPFEPRVGRGAVLSSTQLADRSPASLTDEFAGFGLPIGAQYGVTVYKLIYETVDAQGGTTQASGALFVPNDAPGDLPLLTYQHGTLTTDREVPSALGFEHIIGLIFAADGYVVALPDLLGLGDAPGFHPYVIAEPSATAVVDMLRAVQDFAALNDVPLNDQLFVTGYSQGGYTAMAALRALQNDYSDEFQVTAAAPMAGPYDLSGTMAETFLQPQLHPSPYYLAYTLLAYDAVYDLFDSPVTVFAEPYASQIPPLFDRQTSSGTIDAALPEIPVEMLTPDFVSGFENDRNHPLRRRLQENDVYDWTPAMPMRLYHCAADEHVPQANTLIAVQRFHERGATQVEFIDPMPTGGHGDCIGPSLIFTKLWFDGLVNQES